GRVEKATLLDFGIARIGEGGITITGMMIGTPGYMAPEQARGDKDVDARADIFSIGCVLFQCLTGQRAFGGEDAVAVLARVLFEGARRVREAAPDVPDKVDELVARLLSKDPAGRPKDGGELLHALDALGPIAEVPASRRKVSTGPPPMLTTAAERRLVSVILVAPYA